MTEESKTFRSVSQVSDWARCPWMFKLKRVDKVWQRPAAWLPQGTAVHEAAEVGEKAGRPLGLELMQQTYRQSFAREASAMQAETPNLRYWYASGSYHGELDIPRRFAKGLEQVEKYIDYYNDKAPEEVVWIADGEPAIELNFEIDLSGVPVRGFIDQIIHRPGSGLIARDIKSGNTPGGYFQLATYAVAAQVTYGEEIKLGDYWMGRTGKPTVTYDLTEWPVSRVTERFAEVDAEIKAEKFEPKPEREKCNFCPVRSSCEFAAV